ncbi:class I SAM-dependent methyltransferase [Deinococcus sp.]|uniref:class I SAM-dependent methyltransferase n=1 Tax=Deinococcus sp. TaxID=47478 RepID=UPI003CC5C585
MLNAEFNDPRLVPVYDVLCVWDAADEFFLALANETPGTRVLDLGCGTGRLTLALASAGHLVTGVDPSPASLEAARAKPSAGRVTWLEGTAGALPTAAFDLAVMTSHVAQFITDDGQWAATLAALSRSLVPGGRLAFDSRDPGARGWEAWNPADSLRRRVLPDGRDILNWTHVEEVAGDLVTFVQHYQFSDRPDELLAAGLMRFRRERELRASLKDAGFCIEQIFGGWGREAVGEGCGEFIVVARSVMQGEPDRLP